MPMMMNPFASIARFARSPMFGRGAALTGAAGLGATVPDAVGGAIDAHDEGIRDDTARDIIGGIMDAQEQEARAKAEQEQLYMQGASDAAEMMLGGGGYDDGPDDGGYGDYLGSGEGMYSLAMAVSAPAAPAGGGKAPATGFSSAVKSIPAVKPSIMKLNAADVLADVPGVLAEALGLSKAAVSLAALGALAGGAAGAAGSDSLPEGIRNAAIGAALGGAGGHVAGSPTTRNSIKGMFEAAK